jgi:hypothetical protein
MNRPLSAEPKSGFRLQLVYPDGIEGMIDLSRDVGCGVFAPLADEAFFRTVHIGKHGQISWSEDIESILKNNLTFSRINTCRFNLA